MPAGSTPHAHARAKELFLQTLRRWKAKHGYALELHAILDITAPTEAHWDLVAYSDAPKQALKQAISEAWKRSGGLRQSVVECDDDDLGAVVKYQVKSEVKLAKVDRSTHYIPAAQSDCGLNHHWSTSGFWRGRTVDAIWAEIIRDMFSDDQADDQDQDDQGEGSSNSSNTTLPSTPDPETVYQGEGSSNSSNTTLPSTPDPETVYQAVQNLADFRTNIEYRLDHLGDQAHVLSRVVQRLPLKADEAPTIRTIATQWGLPTADIHSMLLGTRGLSRIKGASEWGWDDRWHWPGRMNEGNHIQIFSN
jgi:hypothetical protein